MRKHASMNNKALMRERSLSIEDYLTAPVISDPYRMFDCCLESDGAAAWRTFSTGYGPLRTLAGKLDAATRAQLERDFVAFHDGFGTALGVCVPRDYLIVHGVRR